MTELIFIVTEAEEGGFSAQSVGQDIFTEADSLAELKNMIRDAVHCHFEEGGLLKLIRMHFTKEEVFSLVA